MAELGGELLLGRIHECVVEFVLHEVDGAAAEAAAHHAGAGHIHLAGKFVEEIEFFAAYLIEFRQAEVGLIHHFADRLIVASLEGVADVEHPLHLTDHVFGAEEILLGNLFADLIEPDALGIAQELHLGVVLADGGGGVLAGGAALVVGAGGELVLDAGVDENKFISFRLEGEVFVFQGLAVEADATALLAEDGGELVHDTALHAAVVVLGGLADLGELELVDSVLEDIIERKGIGALQRRGGRKTRAEGNVTGKDGVEALYLAAALDGLAADAEDVAGPSLGRLVLFFEAEFDILVIIERIGLHLIAAVGLDGCDDALVDGAGEYVPAVVIGMFTDQIDAAGRCK